MKIRVNRRAEKKFKSGYPLVQAEDLENRVTTLPKEWVQFIDSKNKEIAVGYLGEQNKGLGWLVNWNGSVTKKFLTELFTIAKKERATFETDGLTTAYRLFNGEGDGLGGLIIDRYDNFAVFSWYNETLYYHKNEIIQVFQLIFPEIIGAYEKIRFNSDTLPESKFLFGNEAPEPLIVLENGISFAVYLNEGLMTGIFLDQKEVRGRLIDGEAAGKSVLNMFSYTGAFSVAAAMGGAFSTTSVDLAKRSSSKTKEQFEINQLLVENQQIIVMDVFDYFKYAVRKELNYDLIILDPPSFARNKKKVFSVAKNYGDLIKESVDILADNGTIIASTNAANITMKKYKAIIQEALLSKEVQFHIREIYQLPADFRVNAHFEEGNYLKVLFIDVIK